MAREAAGTGSAEFGEETVGALLDAAVAAFGLRFGEILMSCRVWKNGAPCELSDPIGAADEVAVLPPVSGGAH